MARWEAEQREHGLSVPGASPHSDGPGDESWQRALAEQRRLHAQNARSN